MLGGTALLYLINGLRCVDPIKIVVYSSPNLGVFPNVFCWCEMEMGTKNGLGYFDTYKNLNQGRNVLPCCSSIPCKTLVFVSRKSKK